MALPDPSEVVRELPRGIQGVLAPMRTVATGIAVGAVCAAGLGLVTLVLVLQGGENMGDALGRLNQFYPGYDVEPLGVLTGTFYGFATGFAVGWLFATLRNLTIALYVFFVGARERARANRDILDDLM